MRSFCIIIGRVGWGFDPGLLPHLRLGWVSFSWCRGNIVQIANGLLSDIAANTQVLNTAAATITRLLARAAS